MKITDFDRILEKYAELIIKVGINLQPEQRLFIWAQQLEVAPLVHQIVKSAYQNGSRLVSVLWNDDTEEVIRLGNSPRDSFDEFATWKSETRLERVKTGDASLFVGGRDPNLFSGQDSQALGTVVQTYFKNMKPFQDQIMNNIVQWCVICPPTPDWASSVFPGKTPAEAEKKLWEAVIKACRLDEPDPVSFWRNYLNNLAERANQLNYRKYTSLTFKGSGTDLTVGLPEDHIWLGGWDETQSGISFGANLPTEEIYSLPHKTKTEGVVSATKPLSFMGTLVENFSLTFSEGKVVDFTAEKGLDSLRNIIESDENSSYLGEVALVPHKTPISQLGFPFLNTLYDENASNHLALGGAYRSNLVGGTDMTEEEFSKAGGNQSQMHIDFMFGSGEMNVDGVHPDGSTEPLMRAGEWTFDG